MTLWRLLAAQSQLHVCHMGHQVSTVRDYHIGCPLRKSWESWRKTLPLSERGSPLQSQQLRRTSYAGG